MSNINQNHNIHRLVLSIVCVALFGGLLYLVTKNAQADSYAHSPSGEYYGQYSAAYDSNGGLVGMYLDTNTFDGLYTNTITTNKTDYAYLEPIIITSNLVHPNCNCSFTQLVTVFATAITSNPNPPEFGSLFDYGPTSYNANYPTTLFSAIGPGNHNRTQTLYALDGVPPGQYYIHTFTYGYFSSAVRMAIGYVRLPITIGTGGTSAPPSGGAPSPTPSTPPVSVTPPAWDGWIELSGTNHTSPDPTGNGGVTYYEETANGVTKGYLKGYAWGGDVVGWVHFNTDVNTRVCVKNCGGGSSAPPSCTISPIVTGSNVEVNYTIENDPNAVYALRRGTSPIQSGTILTSITTSGSSPYNSVYNNLSVPNGNYYYSLRKGVDIICGPVGPVGVPNIVAPDLQMWLSNDPAEAKETTTIKLGESAQVNWRSNNGAVMSDCSADFDGGRIESPPFPTSFYDGNERPNGQGYNIPATFLTKGTHTFSMICVKGGVNSLSISGKTKSGSTQLKINVTESTIREQ